MALKIKSEHYQSLETAMTAVIDLHPMVRQVYSTSGLSDMRLNWDVLRAAWIDGVRSTEWICRELYPYINDEHIGSALAKIMGNSGMNAQGKRR